MIVFIVLAYPGFIHIIFRLLQFCIYLTNSKICFYEIEQHIVTILLKERSLFMAGVPPKRNVFLVENFAHATIKK
jgi:hypothetical protein